MGRSSNCYSGFKLPILIGVIFLELLCNVTYDEQHELKDWRVIIENLRKGRFPPGCKLTRYEETIIKRFMEPKETRISLLDAIPYVGIMADVSMTNMK